MNKNNWLSAAHQLGRMNVQTYTLYRHLEDGIEWQLNPCLFDEICEFFGIPQIDLFPVELTTRYPNMQPRYRILMHLMWMHLR